MRKFFLILMSVALCAHVYAQQSIKSNEVSDFNSITLSGKLFVDLIPAQENAVEIELNQSDIAKFKWGVQDGVLSVSLRPSGNGAGNATVKIYYKKIDALTISGGEIKSEQPIDADLFTLKASSGTKVILELKTLDSEVEVSSNSIVSLSGVSKYLSIRASESSKVQAQKLEAVSVLATSTTGAEIYTCALERLQAYAKTGSTIFYSGDPTILRVPTNKIMGLGASVHNIGEKK